MEKDNYPSHVLELEQIIGTFFRTMKERHIHDSASVNMSMPQFFCLWVIAKCGKFKMSELAEHLALSYASATNLINRLSDAGLVNRYDDPTDRRVVVVELSPKGKELTDGIRKGHLAEITEKCANLSEDEKKTMIKGFSLVVNLFEKKEKNAK